MDVSLEFTFDISAFLVFCLLLFKFLVRFCDSGLTVQVRRSASSGPD